MFEMERSISISLYYERAAFISVCNSIQDVSVLFSPAIGCNDTCPSFKTVEDVKDDSLDSTSLSSSPQFHWMLQKGMVGLIG